MQKTAIAIIALLLLAACGSEEKPSEPTAAQQLAEKLREQAAQQETAPEVTEEIETAEAPAQEATETPAVEPAAPALETTPAPANPPATIEVGEETYEPALSASSMQDLLNTFADKVQSYQFTYNHSKYFVRDAKIRIVLSKPVQVRSHTWPNGTTRSFFHYDTVYLDRSGQTAHAYCEGSLPRIKNECETLELLDLALPVDFATYNVLLPSDWLMSWLDKEPTVIEADKYYVKGRKVLLLRFNDTELRTDLSIDPTVGLPVLVEQYNHSKRVYRQDYDYLASNRVRAVDVVHRSRSEIPTSDVFYEKNIVTTQSGY